MKLTREKEFISTDTLDQDHKFYTKEFFNLWIDNSFLSNANKFLSRKHNSQKTAIEIIEFLQYDAWSNIFLYIKMSSNWIPPKSQHGTVHNTTFLHQYPCLTVNWIILYTMVWKLPSPQPSYEISSFISLVNCIKWTKCTQAQIFSTIYILEELTLGLCNK